MGRIFAKTDEDMWDRLQKEEKPILLYGMGNGGDKILSVCEQKGIKVSGVFASDGFSRGQFFHGMRVSTYSEMREQYGKEMTVLLAFGTSLAEVLANISRIARECTLYVPDVPVFGGGLFDRAYYNSHLKELNEAYRLFSDAESKRIFECVIDYRLTGEISYLFRAESDGEKVFQELILPQNIKNFADLGAYRGESTKELLDRGAKPEKVFAFEPDERNFRKLQAYAQGETRGEVVALPFAAWNREEILSFDASGNRNASVEKNVSEILKDRGGKTKEIHGMPPDSAIGDVKIDFMKFDVEGSEREAIVGSKQTVLRDAPTLKVALYHRIEDIFEIPLLLKKEFPQYENYYLRRKRGVPAWDLDLYLRKN